MTPLEQANQFIAICRSGFSNEFEWANWGKKHRKEIDSLPYPLRKAVWLAWDQASTPEFSEKRR